MSSRTAASTRPRAALPQSWEFLVAEDGLEGPGAAIADVLRLVNTVAAMQGRRQPPLSWQWTTPEGRPARRFAAQGPRVRRPDVIVVPGWHARNGPHLNRLVTRDRAACDRLRAVHAAGGHVLTLFNGVAMACEAGLLTRPEARAVVPWPFIASVLRHAPSLQLVAGQPQAEHDRIVTVDSPALASEAALTLLAQGPLAGLAAAARSVVLHDPERQRLAHALADDARHRVGPGALERARRWLEDHLHEPYSLAATARAAATSERSLLRHFHTAFGQTPLAMLHAMRVTRARMLLETSYLGTEAIAERCGWRDAAMLRKVFKRATGLTPAAYRDRFRLRAPRREWGREST
jgi:transcriptional regulator GlxA family with amidase domain